MGLNKRSVRCWTPEQTTYDNLQENSFFFFFSNIDHNFINSESLRLVDGDCPGQLERKLKARALHTSV